MRIGQTDAPPPVEWVWKGRMAQGTVTMLGGAGGTGKSSLMAALELCVVLGRPFLGEDTTAGEVIHVDFDTTLGQQFPWYQRSASGLGLSGFDRQQALDRIIYAPPVNGGMMTLERIAQLEKEARTVGARLIAIDAFTSAFGFIRGNVAEDVNQVMAALRALATTGAAVVVLDHTPKPAKNDVEGRGLLGSTMKSAGARAVHLLSRIPPREVAGLDVLRLETHKNNLAPMGDPLGIQRIWDGSSAVRFELYELPDESANLGKEGQARKLLVRILDEHAGEVIPRKELLERVATETGVTQKTVVRAVSAALAEGELRIIELGGKGNPVGYKSVLEPLEASFEDKENPVPWQWGTNLSSNGKTPSETDKDLGTRLVPKSVPNSESALSTPLDLGTSSKVLVGAVVASSWEDE